jgi:hypothetical protein
MIKIFLAMAVSSFSVLASAATIGDTVRDVNGLVRTMTYADADFFCNAQGERLPTQREFAEFSKLKGAKIRETSFPGINFNDPRVQSEHQKNNQDAFWVKLKVDSLGEPVVDFYYSNDAYRTSELEAWDNIWFWTSTVLPNLYHVGPLDSKAIWTSSTGYILSDTSSQNRRNAVRCIQN